ncbi:hypothetical protein [Aquibacillus kalidii]|uniref:hypothetical protein n=1 Tax=Aquibacillus kalidii TaxID=2762597 RepID=UPI0016458CD0|nr:hypothetical protein [Aquibacillus kalidii]
MKNVHKSKPKHGRVIDKLTDEEVGSLRELQIEYDALDRIHVECHTFDDFQKYHEYIKELERKRRDFWEPIYKRNNASWDWHICGDVVNGVAYMINYDDLSD